MKIKKIITFEVPDDYMTSWMEDLACDHVNYYPILDDIHDKNELETFVSEGDWQERDEFVDSEETIFDEGDIDKLHEYFLDKYRYYKGE